MRDCRILNATVLIGAYIKLKQDKSADFRRSHISETKSVL